MIEQPDLGTNERVTSVINSGTNNNCNLKFQNHGLTRKTKSLLAPKGTDDIQWEAGGDSESEIQCS